MPHRPTHLHDLQLCHSTLEKVTVRGCKVIELHIVLDSYFSSTEYPGTKPYYNNNPFAEEWIQNICTSGIVVVVWVRPVHRSTAHLTPPPKYPTAVPEANNSLSRNWKCWFPNPVNTIVTGDVKIRAKEIKQNTCKLKAENISIRRIIKKNTVAWGEGRRVCRAPGASFFLLPWSKYSNLWPSSQIRLHPNPECSLSSHSCFQTGSGSCSIYPEARLLSCLEFFRKVEREREEV